MMPIIGMITSRKNSLMFEKSILFGKETDMKDLEFIEEDDEVKLLYQGGKFLVENISCMVDSEPTKGTMIDTVDIINYKTINRNKLNQEVISNRIGETKKYIIVRKQ